MIAGIGLDVIELDRIESLDSRSPKLRLRILTEKELALYEQFQRRRQIEFLAGRFAAKEAFAKAMGTGIGKDCRFEDIEILPEASGKPTLFFEGKKVGGFLSITHTTTLAAAQVILLT
ncbi:holo-ACP synthase [Sporosarcina sp. HYO08]|uniref:holo-ACP synthase n=1 Tax=Sporosarcina sp. HYO08 TaxID=1759557 RepID=UPI000791F0CB|nr:holo-ACP synthase [Sporosarcina sp. HYO08]KXH80947.1 4'-phosphopantetheinyl transferase [Sporosarcina sp. HYO08]